MSLRIRRTESLRNVDPGEGEFSLLPNGKKKRGKWQFLGIFGNEREKEGFTLENL